MDYLDKDFFLNFFYLGYKEVEKRKEDINKLNVFPVPDGDTGTNMYMTLQSSCEEINKNNPKTVGEVSQCIARGSLMGARGNSGVIMSQIFKGMNIVLKDKDKITPKDLSLSFIEGVSKAYKAVIKPVEGTILTVAKSFAKTLYEKIKEGKNLEDAFLDAIIKGRETLKKTPEMLSILKEAGVVDAGGLGFIFFVEGAYKAIKGREVELEKIELKEPRKFEKLIYPYDVVILLSTNLKEESIMKDFNIEGDSLIVGKEEDFFKIHYHTNNLFDLINYFNQRGTVIKINVENMQYEVDKLKEKKKDVGFIAVSRGKGFEKILKEAGVDYIVEGGQSFNPSTKEILEGIESVNADKIIVFPNNSNVYFSALQTKELTNKKIEVIPTKSIPECITSLTMVDKNKSFEEIIEDLKEYIKNIRTIEVTKSIRDTVFNGTKINEGDFISIYEDRIVGDKESPENSLIKMLKTIEIEDGTLISIYYGEEINEEKGKQLKEKLEELYPNCDIEIYYGGQPLYYYIVALE
ncbi:MAG: DAK2 domain-containing protein [Caldisericia bacterium]|nr:DAK2 domain-containing protein [Caldisericia bacterium]